jgi:rare lipoprotein A
MGTRVTVNNLQNGAEIVAVVVDRIVASGNRIIDLSGGAARALGISGPSAAVAIEVLRERPSSNVTISGESYEEE